MTPVLHELPARLGLDASDFEGLAFWARRGPGGQATLRISVLDDNTSTGLALELERQTWLNDDPSVVIREPPCTRIQECCRYCEDVTYQPLVDGLVEEPITEKRCHLPDEPVPQYVFDSDGGVQRIYIGPEGADPLTSDAGTLTADMQAAYDNWRRDFKLCCPETMEQDPYDGDPKYGGNQCAPYVFNFDYSSGYYCHEPGEILPERNENRCEDGFEANVVVDTEWRLFTIPWGELRRFTPNRPPIDPRGIWKVAFYFGAGNLDTYVDDVGFYRKRN
jgi:hypothetical protein